MSSLRQTQENIENLLSLFPLLSPVAAAAIKFANIGLVDTVVVVDGVLLVVFDDGDDVTVFCFK